MKIIISPAKTMQVDADSFLTLTEPFFLKEAEQIRQILQEKTPTDLQKLWQCNEKIALLNIKRLQNMDLQNNLTPAILAYEGIQYQNMAPNVFSLDEYQYIQSHLRILSGFYGSLRPFDGVVPYRLEMQTKLSIGSAKNLYEFWSDKVAKELLKETDFILNLASKEYSKIIEFYAHEKTEFITCVFAEHNNGKIIEKGTLCKMARGKMVRFLTENNITDKEKIKEFDNLGYHYDKSLSTSSTFVFIKRKSKVEN